MRWRSRAALLLLGGWVAAAGTLGATAALDANRARHDLAALRTGMATADVRSVDLEARLHHVAARLDRSHDRLAGVVLSPVRAMPFVGRQVRSAAALAGAGSVTADVAASSLRDVRAATDRHDGRVAQLDALERVARSADQRLGSVHLGPDRALVGPLRRARNDAVHDISQARTTLQRAAAGASGMRQMLASDGNQLVIAANNGEMRAGSGMFLSVGILRTGGGQLHLQDMATVGSVAPPASSVHWPDGLDALWGWLGKEADFRNLMASPRFDVAAPIAKQVWEGAGKPRVDGVIVIDPATLQAILSATGPVRADGTEVSSSNVVPQLLLQQYRGLDGTRGAQQQRREVLSDVAGAAFEKLNAGAWDPLRLARALGGAADARHVLLWSSTPAIDAQWKAAGVSGEVGPDSLMLNVVNLGGNKLDQFLRVDATLATTLGRSGIEESVVVKIANAAPPDLPQYVEGPFPGSGLAPGDYQGMLSFTLPGDARGARFDGSPPLAVAGSDGPSQAFATKVRVAAGASTTFTMRFSRPATARQTVVEPSARIPATTWHVGGSTWLDDHRHAVDH